jgi:hypothetical protein
LKQAKNKFDRVKARSIIILLASNKISKLGFSVTLYNSQPNQSMMKNKLIKLQDRELCM